MIGEAAALVPFLDLQREQQEDRARLEPVLRRVVEGGRFVLGPELEAFERELARYVGVRHAVGVANGQDALELILRTLELGPDDEVVVPGMTFVATASAVLLAGARPVFCDVGPDGSIDPDVLRRAITPRSRAVIVVHLHGKCADMGRIGAIAAENGLTVVEDACQAHGAELEGRRAGSLGRAAACSFYPSKNLGCLGDGGAVVTDDGQIHERVRLLRNYGSRRKYEHEILGRNSRLDEIQAAVLRAKLTDLDARNDLRRQAASAYRRALATLPIRLPVESSPGSHVYHVFGINLESAGQRRRLREHLARRGIETLCHYPLPLDRQPCLSDHAGPPLEGAARFAATTLSLPIFPSIRSEEIELVIEAVTDYFGRGRGAE